VIVDSSAVVAILQREDGWERLLRALAADPAPGMGVPTIVESGIVLAARAGLIGKTLLARFLQESAVRPIPLTDEHWTLAVDAYLRFGKGRHPAALNYGDCLTYAVARLAGEPLLCVGDGFARTDLALVARTSDRDAPAAGDDLARNREEHLARLWRPDASTT
jgi:ribonuclease VapC